MKINKSKCKHTNCSCHSHHKIGSYPIHEGRRQILQEGTKYDKKAAAKLANSGLFDEETSKRIVDALFKEDIHAFVHSPSWLEKYLIGIVNMLIKYCDGDRSKAQEFLTNSIENFEEYLTYIKELRPTLEQEKQLALDKTFNEEMSYEDMLQELNSIRSQRDAESAEKLKSTEFTEESDFDLIPIDSFEDFNDMFGGRATGDGSSDAYAGGGGTAWCHTNSEPTYNNWVSGDKKFFVLAHKDWENIPFDKESNSNNPKDAYGNSLIALLVSDKGRLLKATLRCNHVGVPSNADNQYKTYAELSEIAGFNVEVAVKEALGVDLNAEGEDVETCANCGVVIEDGDWSHHTPDGELYCEECFNEYYVICYECEEVVDRDEAYWGTDGNGYCVYCFDDRFFYCSYCGVVFDLDDGLHTPDGIYCDDCAERAGWVRCCDCGEVVKRDYAYYVDYEWYCEDCYHDSYFYCDECGEDCSQDELCDTPDGPVCQSCFNDKYFVCEICDGVFNQDEGYHTDDGWVCQDCYEEQEDDMEESIKQPTNATPDKPYDDLEDNFNLNEFLEKHGIR